MLGFPIRTSSDHSSVDSSPRLIAASYVLHRLLVPRHPPCALKNLATKMLASTVQFSNNNPTPTNTTTHPRRSPKQFDSRPARRKKQTTGSNPHRSLPYARPLRTQQRTYSSSPTTQPVPTHPNKGMDNTWPRRTTQSSRRTRHHMINDRPN